MPGRGEVFVRDLPSTGAATVLLLHGWTSTADLTWWAAYAKLAPQGRVVALDHRGHGRGLRTGERFTLEAAADDAAALLRVLGCGPAVVCGYSMGGPIALLLAQRHPDLVGGLVLEATALEWRTEVRERLLWRGMSLLERVLRSARSQRVVQRVLRELLEKCPALREHRGWLEGELRRGDPEAIADAGRALGRFDGRSFAPAIGVPVAVVLTTDDHLVRPSKQRAMAAAIPGTRLFELDADHDACLTDADAFAAVTVEAVRSVLAGSEPGGPALTSP